MAAYLGTPATLEPLSEDTGHSLYRQSYAARELHSASVSADGWGAAWYLPGDEQPCLYRCTLPIWADVNRPHLARTIRSTCLLAAVRSATDPLSVCHANTQPFAWGRLAFVHNGFVEDFSARVLRKLRTRLSDHQYQNVRGNTDSEHLFALIADRYEAHQAEPGAQRLRAATGAALGSFFELTEQADSKAQATLIVSDGSSLVAFRGGSRTQAPSLYYRERENAVWIASEPLDEGDDWRRLPDAQGLVVSGRDVAEWSL